MAKVIERPTSTTHVVDFLFHLVKDETEMKNILAASQGKEIFKVAIVVDMNTFQPMMYFSFVEKDKPFSEWMKYVARMAPMAE